MADVETKRVSFKNISDGPRGVNGVGGVVLIEKGDSATVEVTEAEFKSAVGTGHFEDGEGAAEPGPLDQSIPKLTEYLATVEDVADIDQLIADETAGKSREGALAALNDRKAELEA